MNIQGGGGGGGDGGGGGGGGNNQSQLQLQPPQAQPQQPPPPQRCPRCDSVNTKFCYYNNYSLSQPRYFCKTCKRYWTHGGSLRNIPIGGGCRKGKRTKTTLTASSSSTTLQLMNQAPQLQPNAMTLPASRVVIGGSSVVAAAPAVPSISSYYQGGGAYLSSPSPAIQSQNSLTQPLFNLSSLNLVPSSNLGLHPWFNPPSTLAPKGHIPQSSAAVFQSESLYPSDHHNQGLVQTRVNMMGNSSYASLHDWSQNSLWSTVSTTSMGDNSGSPSNINNEQSNDNNANKAVGSSSLSANQWPDDQPTGYGPPR